MSSARAFGDSTYGFEEGARRLPLFRQGNMELEVGLGATHGQSPHLESGAGSKRQQHVRLSDSIAAGVMHDKIPGVRGVASFPIGRDARQHVPLRPASGNERLELGSWGPPQGAAHNEHVSAAAAPAERPHPGHVPGLQEDDQRHAGKRRLGFANCHLNSARTKPAHCGALAESGQTVLHPTHEQAALPDIPDRPGGKPGDNRNRDNGDQFRHGGPHDSTPPVRRWSRALWEFVYGMTSYEFVQQALEMRASMQRLFLLGVFGDMLGVPVLPPYYGLRLLPYVVPQIESWKRDLVRERDLGSDHEHHLHGL